MPTTGNFLPQVDASHRKQRADEAHENHAFVLHLPPWLQNMLVKPSLADSQLSTLPALPAWETASHPSVLNALLIAHPTVLAALTSNKSFGLTASETWDRMSTVSSTCRLPAGLLPSVHMHTHTHSPLERLLPRNFTNNYMSKLRRKEREEK